jgi:thiamine kinase-like enzyme
MLEAINKFTTKEELDFLRKIAPKDVVFSHNDLLANNIMVVDGTLKFIDFEYGSMNYRAFDLADHFFEFCIDYDYPKYPFFEIIEESLPSKEEMIEAIKLYFVFYDH